MKQFLNRIKSYALLHKVISSVIVIVILFTGYSIYKKLTSNAGDNRYIFSKVEKGNLIASVSGSGQVSAENQVDIKTKSSGDVIYVRAQSGEKVYAGTLIAQLNSKDAEKTVRDAEVNLESAKIALEKLKIQKSDENMSADLTQAYDDGFNTVSNAFIDLPGIMTGLNNIFFKAYPSTGQWGIDYYESQVANIDKDQAKVLKNNLSISYNQARTSYNANFENYKSISRGGDKQTLEDIILQTYNTVTLVSDVIKNASNYLDFVNDSLVRQAFNTPALLTSDKTTLSGYTSKTNTHLVNILSTKTNIKNYKDAFQNSDLDIQSSLLSVKQKENALQDAKDKLADYFIRAPFDGTIAKIDIKKADSVNSGTVVATLITKTQLAELSLNEVDVAKIKIGQKATLTFDAIPDLTISGKVVEMDALGAVSQGVVTYDIKISFDTQDDRVKSGMSVSAAIITEVKQNILVVPNSAIKSQGGVSYVEVFTTPLPEPTDGLIGYISKIVPTKKNVEVGLSNDSHTEIISGLNEGDEVISRTILPSSTKSTASAPSIFGATNTRGATGNATRATAR